jgi:hypothetical protein
MDHYTTKNINFRKVFCVPKLIPERKTLRKGKGEESMEIIVLYSVKFLV